MLRTINACRIVRRSISAGNFNKNEVDKFSAVGGNWWNRSSPTGTGPLHDMNPVRVGFIRQQLAIRTSTELLFESDQIRGLKILDVGCGGGLLCESLSRLGAVVTGIDPSAENIAVATKHSKLDPLTANISYKEATVEDILASGEKFDAVCSLEVVEHVDDARAFVAACGGCVAADGSLFLSTMNRTQKAYLMTVLGAEYVLGLVPKGTHDWSKYISPADLKEMVESSGNEQSACKVQKISGIVLQPPSLLSLSSCGNALRNWTLSERDLDVNYILHAVKSQVQK